ncbi:YoaK family protein [Secundilactobacillus oryzae]|uniref:YoaK family protein n=1 Tax=Secundilactobacillus oryzae TaxID=1202668 RepID=UPI00068BC1AF|nr:YoaK family protein [Secundilactobacillus oryzae]
MRTQQYPAYQQLYFGAILAAIAGGVDAYTYLEHGGVFAGLQTGNLILMGVSLNQGEIGKVGRYALAIFAFILGTILVKVVQHFMHQKPMRQAFLVLIYELILMIIVILMGVGASNVLIIVLLAMTMAGQLQQFRQLEGNPFTSLMMTGNIRNLADNLYELLIKQNRGVQSRLKSIGIVIGGFLAGVVLTALAVSWIQTAALIVPVLLVIGGMVYLNRHRYDGVVQMDSETEELTRASRMSRRH